MSTIRAVVEGRRIVVPALREIPDGAEVFLTIETERVEGDNGPASPEEIARVLSAMQRLEPLEIPEDSLSVSRDE